MMHTIQPHNNAPAAAWSAGGKAYDEVSRGIADSIEHCVLRLNPRPGERILDLSTGPGRGRGAVDYREPSGDAAWLTFSNGYGPTRSLAAGLGPEWRDGFRADFTAFHAGFATELGICVPREYLVTIGVRV